MNNEIEPIKRKPGARRGNKHAVKPFTASDVIVLRINPMTKRRYKRQAELSGLNLTQWIISKLE